MEKYIYGIDIGGTNTKIGLFSLEGDLLDKWEIVTNKTDNGIHILKEIYESINGHQIDLKDVLGYGFGVPGPVMDGYIIKGINIDWENYNLKTEFIKLVKNEKVFVENDANVAALGETWQGAAKGYINCAMITIGTGVGGGIIVNGEVVVGAHGSGGEIGHIRVVHENGLLCNCGCKGCLETVASATAKTGIVGGVAEIPAEIIKQSTQKTRTIEESLINIGGATLLSGILGGTIKGITKVNR